jgi:ATP-dependent RNA helicase DDX54/DBP10
MVAQKRSRSKTTWDKKKKKFVRGDGTGADNVKMVKAESGIKLPASYRSGRFDEWRAKTRATLPRIGEVVPEHQPSDRKRFKHTSITVRKPLDKFATTYERKARIQKRVEAVNAFAEGEPTRKGRHSTGRYGSKPMGQVRSEIKSAEQIRKARKAIDKRKAKNARPSRKKGKR